MIIIVNLQGVICAFRSAVCLIKLYNIIFEFMHDVHQFNVCYTSDFWNIF